MSASRIAKIAAVIVLSIGFSGPAIAEEGPFPVWWSPVLELESLDQIDARLEGEMWPSSPGGLALYKYEGGSYDSDSRTEAWADSCNALKRRTKEGYSGAGSHDRWVQQYHLAVCQGIKMLNRARPARESFLRDFRLDEKAIDYLPAMVDISPSCDMLCRQRVANERRIPLSAFEPVFRVTVTSDEEIEIRTIGFETDLTILARGDFNGDDLDDLLVLASGGATEGTGAWADTFLLTREAPGAVLMVLEEGTEVCGHYQCDATYDYPEALRETNPDAADLMELSGPRTPITAGAFGLVPPPPEFSAVEVIQQIDATWTEGPPYPVWWSPNLFLNSLEAIDERLEEDIWLGGLDYWLEAEIHGTTVETSAKSCAALISLVERGYRTSSRYLPDDSTIMYCRALYALKQARPAKVSHLRDLVLDDKVLEILPALLDFWTTSCDECRARAFNESPISWARFAAERAANQQIPSFSDGNVYWVKALDERRLQARALAWAVEIEFLAGGDFDGDGLDDVLVRRDIRDDLRAYYDSALFVLSRDSPDGVLWALNTEETLDAERACEVAGIQSTASAFVEAQCSMRANESTGDSHAETYPVWWSDDFELSGLDQVDRRMHRGFSRPSSGAFQMDKRPGLKDGPVLARNCEELLGYVNADYTIETDHNFGHWQAMRCRAILALKDARPASVSHLRDFALDAGALDLFPMFFRDTSLRFGRCRQHLYNQARFSIKAGIGEQPTQGRNVFDTADPSFQIETHSNREIFITTRHRSARLTIVASGDFNGDGLDDILLETNRWQFHRDSASPVTETSTGWTENKHFILSRDCPDGVLWVVNADDFLYSKEDCDDWRAETEWSVKHW